MKQQCRQFTAYAGLGRSSAEMTAKFVYLQGVAIERGMGVSGCQTGL